MLYQLSYSRMVPFVCSRHGRRMATALFDAVAASMAPSEKSGESRIRTYEVVRQQIYSLPPLATWVSPQERLSEPMEGLEPTTG